MKETSKSKLFVALLAGISFVTALVASAVARQPQNQQQAPATAAAPAAAPNGPAPLKKQRRPAPPENEEAARGQTQFAAYLHWRIAEGLSSSEVPNGYPAEKLLTGNAQAGKAFFEGEGGCTKCHSAAGDLANVSGKYSAIDLEAQMLYPEGNFKTAKITLKSGEVIEGKLNHLDEFSVAITDADGWFHAYSRSDVKVEVTDKLAVHRALLDKLSQKQMHDLYAYVHTLEKEAQAQ
jgi:hypothetical protein